MRIGPFEIVLLKNRTPQQGPLGPQGVQGQVGPPGATGPQGPQGEAGRNGADASDGLVRLPVSLVVVQEAADNDMVVQARAMVLDCIAFYAEQGILLQPQVFGLVGDEVMLTYQSPDLLSQHYWQNHFHNITVYIGSSTARFPNGTLGEAARASLTAIIAGNHREVAETICHEIAHVLGLGHDESPGNFMNGRLESSTRLVNLEQQAIMLNRAKELGSS